MDKKIGDMGKHEFCLWAFKSSKNAEEIKKLCSGKEEMYLILVENKDNKNTSSGYHAVGTDDPQIKIPSDMWVTGSPNSHAYVVKDIIEITDGQRGKFSRSRYERIVYDFNSCNEFRRFKPGLTEKKDRTHEVRYVLVLKYPFIVKLDMVKN